MDKSKNEIILTGVILDDTTTFTLTEVRRQYNIEDALWQEMLEYGLIEPTHLKNEVHISLPALRRLQSALHLHDDLGVNMPGVALALDLLEELGKAHEELSILHKHLQNNLP